MCNQIGMASCGCGLLKHTHWDILHIPLVTVMRWADQLRRLVTQAGLLVSTHTSYSLWLHYDQHSRVITTALSLVNM